MGYPSIALAQAIQFETGLRQKEVIGELLPQSEPGVSDVIDADTKMKWLHGLRWSSIDQNYILRHTTSMRKKEVQFDLRKMRMVMEELDLIEGGRQFNSDPIILNEDTGKPYQTHKFRRRWRKIADAAGVPKSVKNMDSRPDTSERPVMTRYRGARL